MPFRSYKRHFKLVKVVLNKCTLGWKQCSFSAYVFLHSKTYECSYEYLALHFWLSFTRSKWRPWLPNCSNTIKLSFATDVLRIYCAIIVLLKRYYIWRHIRKYINNVLNVKSMPVGYWRHWGRTSSPRVAKNVFRAGRHVFDIILVFGALHIRLEAML